MDVEIIDEDAMEIVVIDDDDEDDNLNAAEVSEIIDKSSTQFPSNFKSLQRKEQLQAIQTLRANLHISNCPLVYNPACSFAFNLALKINSINFEAFKKTESSLENLLVMGHAVLRVHRDCNSFQWLTHIIEKLRQTNEEPKNGLEEFYRKIWEMKNETDFPFTIVKSIVEIYPTVLEDLVIEITMKCSENDERTLKNHLRKQFQEENTKTWVNLCSKSPLMFQMSVSMIQTLLHYSRGDRKVVALAQTFHDVVSARVDDPNPLRLYPSHLQPLVYKLQCRTLGDLEVMHELSDLIVFERAACQCLLTFYPKWLPHLLVFTQNNGEARIISEEFSDWHV